MKKRLLEIGNKKTDERAKLENKARNVDNHLDEIFYIIDNRTKEEKKLIEDSLN